MKYLGIKRRRDFRAKRAQFIAVLVTITLGVFLFASSWDAYRNLEGSYQGTYDRLAFADMTVTGADPRLVGDLDEMEGVAAVEERRQGDIPVRIASHDDHVLSGRLVGMPTDEQPSVNKLDIIEGEYLDSEQDEGIIVDTHMADHFELAVGDTLEIFDGFVFREFDVIGVALSAEYVWPAKSRSQLFVPADDFGVLYVPEEILEAANPNAVQDQILVTYDEDADTEEMDLYVEAQAKRREASDSVTQADQPSNAALQLDVQGFEQMAIFFPVMFLIAAGMSTAILMTRLVLSQRSQIGTLMANGVDRGSVLRHYMGFGLILGVAGGIIGIALGVPAGAAMTSAYTMELGIPDTVVSFHPWTPIVGLLFGAIVGPLSAWTPARLAAKTDPAEAMRGDIPTDGGGLSLFERVVPPLQSLPTRWKMIVRGIGRSKRRSGATILGTIIALVLILAAWGMIDTIVILVDRQFNEIQLEDGIVVFDTPVGDRQIADVRDVDGVLYSEKVITLEVSAQGPDDNYSTQIFGFDPDTNMHGFDTDSGELPPEGIVAGSAIGDIVGAEVGDTITLDFPELDTEFRVRIADFVNEPLGTLIYMDQDALVEAMRTASDPIGEGRLNEPSTAVVMARFEPDVSDRDAVFEEIEDVRNAIATSDSRMFYIMIEDFLGLFYLIVGFMLVFSGALAFALIFNTTSANLAERAGEFANMRANGVSNRQVGQLIMGENLLLTALGIPPGLILGYIVAGYAMSTYSTDLFAFDMEMRPESLLYASIAMMLVALISVLPGLRAMRKLDMGKVVRERSQ